jgi:cell wall-associated NlpC family hydrolase
MGYGVININVVSVRQKNNAKSEMISQLFFGEIITIIEVNNNWSLIRSNLDDYKGWIRNLHYQKILKEDYNILSNNQNEFATNEMVLVNSNFKITVPTGSLISSAKFLKYNYKKTNASKSITKTIKSFLNTPYLWGGKTKFGTDCSGLVQSIFKTINIILPRDACDQYKSGKEINSDFKLGDLAFFGKSPKKITHVGILINNTKIVHAYGVVRIDKLTSKGIYNNEEKRITHILQKVKRIS